MRAKARAKATARARRRARARARAVWWLEPGLEFEPRPDECNGQV